MEMKIMETGDRAAIKKLYPHLAEPEITRLIKNQRKDKDESVMFNTELEIKRAKKLQEAGITGSESTSSVSGGRTVQSGESASISIEPKGGGVEVTANKIDNKAKHSEESSKQPGKNSDPRPKDTKKKSKEKK